jgi:hypothetical protein
VRASRYSTDEFVKKEYILNQNIAHLIDNIFWNMPFKNPTQADRVIILIIFIKLIMLILVIVYDYVYYADCAYYGNYFDYMYYGNYAYYADCFVNSDPYLT